MTDDLPMSDDLRTRLWRVLEAHGLGWIDNGKSTARCYCGHTPWLGESWHHHVADAVIRELNSACIYRYTCASCGDFWFDSSERMQRFALMHSRSHTADE